MMYISETVQDRDNITMEH